MIQKIAAFWLCVCVVMWLLKRRPNSAISKLAFSWQSPHPVEGELKSSYYRRKAIFALGWLAQILTAAALVALAMYAMPRSRSIDTPIMVAAFTLTIGCGMAVLGALLAALVSLKASLLGPDPAFSLPEPGRQLDARESEQESSEI
jgi:hypothetical protein